MICCSIPVALRGRKLLQLGVLFRPVNSPELLHVFLNVFLGLVFNVLVALQVLWVFAGFELLVHHSMSQLEGKKKIKPIQRSVNKRKQQKIMKGDNRWS